MTQTEKFHLQNVALALLAYAKAAKEDAELQRLLDRVEVPGGYGIDEFAKEAVKLSGAHEYVPYRAA